jgi:hypothetical protein
MKINSKNIKDTKKIILKTAANMLILAEMTTVQTHKCI